MMPCTVILIAYHSDRWIQPCVESLVESAAKPIHLVMVDNSGNRRLDNLAIGSFRVENVKTPEPMGFAEANNYALVHAKSWGDTVAFLNQDTVSTMDWVARCTELLKRNPDVGAVSPLIRNYDDSAWDPSFLACLPDGQSEGDLSVIGTGDSDDFLETRYVPAPALVIRSDLLQQIGPFDPIFGSYYEDYDLCRRIGKAGYRVGFCRSAVIQHFSGSTTDSREKELRRMRQILRNRLILRLRERDGSSSRWPGLLQHACIDTPRRVLRGLLGRTGAQPIGVVLGAQRDLVEIGGRLASADKDARAWKSYLESINWAQTGGKLVRESAEPAHGGRRT